MFLVPKLIPAICRRIYSAIGNLNIANRYENKYKQLKSKRDGIDMRIKSIDIMRVLAVFGVVALHTQPFRGPQYFGTPYMFLSYFIDQFFRFAVPFFFVASGYFFGKKLQSHISVNVLFFRYFKRLFTIFVLWSIVYAVIPQEWLALKLKYGSFDAFYWPYISGLAKWIRDNPLIFVMQGTRGHLWFLVSLIISLFILTVFISLNWQRHILFFSIILYVTGLLGGAYSNTPFGINIHFDTRNGPFLGTFPTVLGWWLSQKEAPSASAAALLTLGGFALHIAEMVVLRQFFSLEAPPEYLIGTVFFGLGIFCLALAYPDMGHSSFLQSLGKFTLGVYCSHILIRDTVAPLGVWVAGPLWEVAFPNYGIYVLSAI